MKMTKEQMASIFSNQLNEKIIACTDVSKGVEQQVTIIEAASGKYVLKFPEKKEMNFREVMACELLKNKIPVPEIIFHNEDFVLEKFITGNDLDEVTLTDAAAEKIYTEAGRLLAIIHSHTVEGFGIIMPNGKGKHNNLSSFSLYNEGNLKRLRNAYLSSSEIKKLVAYIEQRQQYFDNANPVLLHYDFIDPNIRVDNDEITGIIDFGDLSGGVPALDLAWIYIHHNANKLFNFVYNGYGKNIDIEAIKFFAACNLVWFIVYEKDKHAIKHKLALLDSIVKYKSSFSFFKR